MFFSITTSASLEQEVRGRQSVPRADRHADRQLVQQPGGEERDYERGPRRRGSQRTVHEHGDHFREPEVPAAAPEFMEAARAQRRHKELADTETARAIDARDDLEEPEVKHQRERRQREDRDDHVLRRERRKRNRPRNHEQRCARRQRTDSFRHQRRSAAALRSPCKQRRPHPGPSEKQQRAARVELRSAAARDRQHRDLHRQKRRGDDDEHAHERLGHPCTTAAVLYTSTR